MTKRLIAASVLAVTLITSPTFAASDDECAIWLCLPVSFAASGCSGPFSAFKDRIKHFKSPLPNLASCLVSSDDVVVEGIEASQMTSQEGIAAFIPATKTMPKSYVKGIPCRSHHFSSNTPRGCIRTDRYVQTLMDGMPYGDVFYY